MQATELTLCLEPANDDFLHSHACRSRVSGHYQYPSFDQAVDTLRGELKSFLGCESEESPGRVVLLTGEPGSGKSTLLSQFVDDVNNEISLKDSPVDAPVCFVHSVGVSPQSHGLRWIFQRFCHAITRHALGFQTSFAGFSLADFAAVWRRVLREVGQHKRLIFVVDGMDAISSPPYATSMSWVPDQIPSGVMLVFSCRSGSIPASALKSRFQELRVVEMPSLTHDDVTAILQSNTASEGAAVSSDLNGSLRDSLATITDKASGMTLSPMEVSLSVALARAGHCPTLDSTKSALPQIVLPALDLAKSQVRALASLAEDVMGLLSVAQAGLSAYELAGILDILLHGSGYGNGNGNGDAGSEGTNGEGASAPGVSPQLVWDFLCALSPLVAPVDRPGDRTWHEDSGARAPLPPTTSAPYLAFRSQAIAEVVREHFSLTNHLAGSVGVACGAWWNHYYGVSEPVPAHLYAYGQHSWIKGRGSTGAGLCSNQRERMEHALGEYFLSQFRSTPFSDATLLEANLQKSMPGTIQEWDALGTVRRALDHVWVHLSRTRQWEALFGKDGALMDFALLVTRCSIVGLQALVDDLNEISRLEPLIHADTSLRAMWLRDFHRLRSAVVSAAGTIPPLAMAAPVTHQGMKKASLGTTNKMVADARRRQSTIGAFESITRTKLPVHALFLSEQLLHRLWNASSNALLTMAKMATRLLRAQQLPFFGPLSESPLSDTEPLELSVFDYIPPDMRQIMCTPDRLYIVGCGPLQDGDDGIGSTSPHEDAVYVWDFASGAEVFCLRPNLAGVTGISLAPPPFLPLPGMHCAVQKLEFDERDRSMSPSHSPSHSPRQGARSPVSPRCVGNNTGLLSPTTSPPPMRAVTEGDGEEGADGDLDGPLVISSRAAAGTPPPVTSAPRAVEGPDTDSLPLPQSGGDNADDGDDSSSDNSERILSFDEPDSAADHLGRSSPVSPRRAGPPRKGVVQHSPEADVDGVAPDEDKHVHVGSAAVVVVSGKGQVKVFSLRDGTVIAQYRLPPGIIGVDATLGLRRTVFSTNRGTLIVADLLAGEQLSEFSGSGGKSDVTAFYVVPPRMPHSVSVAPRRSATPGLMCTPLMRQQHAVDAAAAEARMNRENTPAPGDADGVASSDKKGDGRPALKNLSMPSTDSMGPPTEESVTSPTFPPQSPNPSVHREFLAPAVIAGHRNGCVALLRLHDGKSHARLGNHDDLVSAVTPVGHRTAHYTASCSVDGTVRVWDMLNREQVNRLVRSTSNLVQQVQTLSVPLYTVGSTLDGKMIVCGGRERTVRAWEWKVSTRGMSGSFSKGKTWSLPALVPAKVGVRALCVIGAMAVASAGVQLQDLPTAIWTEYMRRMLYVENTGHAGNGGNEDGDSTKPATPGGGSFTQRKALLRANSGVEGSLRRNSSVQLTCSASASALSPSVPDSPGQQGTALVEDKESGSPLPIPAGSPVSPSSTPTSASRNHHSRALLAASMSSASLAGNTVGQKSPAETESTSWRPAIRIWHLFRGQRIRFNMGGFLEPVRAAVVSADGRLAITGSQMGTLRLWDLFEGKELSAKPLDEVGVPVTSAAAAAHGRYLAVALADGTVRLYNDGEADLADVLTVEEPYRCIVLSHNGKTLMGGRADGTIDVVDLIKRTTLRRLEGTAGAVNSLALTDDGTILISGGADGMVRVWAWENGQLTKGFVPFKQKEYMVQRVFENMAASLIEDTERVNAACMAVAACRDRVIAGFSDGGVFAWKTETGAPLFTVYMGADPITSISATSGVVCVGTAAHTVGMVSFDGQVLCRHFIDAVPAAIVCAPGPRVLVGDASGTVHILAVMSGRTGGAGGITSDDLAKEAAENGDKQVNGTQGSAKKEMARFVPLRLRQYEGTLLVRPKGSLKGLRKATSMANRWKTRYGVVRNGQILIYKNKPSADHQDEPSAQFHFGGRVTSAKDGNYYTFDVLSAFDVETNDRKLYNLGVESYEELEEWLNVLT
eukprot:Rmarinus@m.6412